MTTDQMPMNMWYATEGGRKCPMCGRYAKAEQLGVMSFSIKSQDGSMAFRVSQYGHKKGTGCNKGEL